MLSSDQVLDDPGVFWDEDSHQAYLICNTASKQKSEGNKIPGNENRIYKMSWDGMELHWIRRATSSIPDWVPRQQKYIASMTPGIF